MDISLIRRRNLRKIIDVDIGKGLFKNDAEFCKKKDLDSSYISQLVNGHRNIGERSARNIEVKLKLKRGTLDNELTSDQLDNNIDLNNKIYDMGRNIPVISWVQAGSWTSLDSIPADTEFEDWLPPNKDSGKNGYGLIVVGESMLPKFEPDDRIYVNPDFQVNDLKTGDNVIVSCEGDTEATFKKIIIEPNAKYLEPINPDWKDKRIELKNGCRLVGKVVGIYRKV